MLTVTRETHETPPEIARILALAGGLNRFGEPNFRAVWGWNRLGWIGGRWTDRDASGAVVRETIGVRRAPKYFPHDRWHIERWCPPESYGSPEEWARATLEIKDGINVPALGPYPSRGEYEHVFTVARILDARGPAACDSQHRRGPEKMSTDSETVCSGTFLQLTPTIAERIARMIEFGRAVRRPDSREALMRREAARDRAYDSFADTVLSDV